MNVPLLDLVAQYRSIKDDVLAGRDGRDRAPGLHHGRRGGAAGGRRRRSSPTPSTPLRCASGTDALLLPLKALDLQPGDEVITTPFTFFATAGTIHNAGGTPVFVDIDPATFNISPCAIEAAITPRTRAIVVVHLFGQMAAMEEIVPIAARHGLPRDRGRGAVHRRPAEDRGDHGAMAGELGTVGHPVVLSQQEPGRLGRRRHDGDPGRRAGRAAPAAPAARRRQAVLPRGGGHQQPAGHAAGRRAAGQAAPPGRVERGPRAERRPLHRRVRRPPGDLPPEGRTRPTSTSSTSTPSGSPGGTSCRRISRPRASATRSTIRCPAPAALLRLPGLPARGACR